MRTEHYFAIGLKLLSIVLFVYGISFTPTIIEVLFYGTLSGLPARVTYFVISLGVCWGLALVLWVFPLTVAKKFLSPELSQVVEPMATPSVITVVVIAVGLYAFAFGVMDIFYWGVYIHLAENNIEFFLDPETKANIAATVLQLVSSMLLILKSRSISNLIVRVAT